MDGINSIACGSVSPRNRGVQARVAVLEEIAAATRQGIADMRADTMAKGFDWI